VHRGFVVFPVFTVLARSRVVARTRLLGCLLVLVACGGPPPPRPHRPERPPDPFLEKHEAWVYVDEQRYVVADTCGMGPYEIVFPERAADDPRFAYGRRLVFLVYGPRKLSIDNRVETRRVQTGIHVSGDEIATEHLACRAGDGVPVGTVTGTARAGGTAQPVARVGAPAAPRNWHLALDAPSDALPKLAPHDGPAPRSPQLQQSGAMVFFPQGNPYYYADEYWSQRHVGEATAAVRLRFWFPMPSDLRGMVFRVIEEALVPEELPDYAADFARRVAMVTQRHDDERPAQRRAFEERLAHCEAFPDDATRCRAGRVSMSIPPPPRAEVRPKAPPGDDLAWVPGYWSFDDELADFVWISGTYVVRPKRPVVVAAAPVASPPVASPPVASPPVASPPVASPPVVVEPARELDAAIAAAPAPKVEAVAPPPPAVAAQPNAVWVAGHWVLVGRTWRWTPGAWINGPVGTRFRAPVVHVRNQLRIYLPGGWVRLGS
jgi:hypothetical protein